MYTVFDIISEVW